MKYMILTELCTRTTESAIEHSTKLLANKLTDYSAKGWQRVGELSVTYIPDNLTIVFSQMIVKYDEPKTAKE